MFGSIVGGIWGAFPRSEPTVVRVRDGRIEINDASM